METGPIVPRAWLDELATLEIAGLSAFVAGGAVRDLILRRPRKDVDIWLLEKDADAAARLAELLDWKVISDGGYAASDILAVYEYLRHGETYNVIVAKFATRDEIINRFDFGISRAAIVLRDSAGSGDFPVVCDLVVYPEFVEDMARKVFKVRHDNGSARTAARWTRLQERYPDWTFEDLEDPLRLPSFASI